MVRFLADTSCIVATLQPGHQQKRFALAALNQRIDRGEHLVVAGHSLAEAYSVLTRMPPPHRAAPAEAMAVLQASFIDQAEVVTLDSHGYGALLRRAAADGIAGGRIYDAIIAACAVQAKVTVVLTFNVRHFRDLLPANVEVNDPSE